MYSRDPQKNHMQSILKFCKGLPEVTFEPGQTLLDEQGRDGVLYVLIEGAVEVVKGNLVVCRSQEPGAIFGELAVLLDVPHTASVRALTRCRVYRVQEANKFLRGNQDLTSFSRGCSRSDSPASQAISWI